MRQMQLQKTSMLLWEAQMKLEDCKRCCTVFQKLRYTQKPWSTLQKMPSTSSEEAFGFLEKPSSFWKKPSSLQHRKRYQMSVPNIGINFRDVYLRISSFLLSDDNSNTHGLSLWRRALHSVQYEIHYVVVCELIQLALMNTLPLFRL